MPPAWVLTSPNWLTGETNALLNFSLVESEDVLFADVQTAIEVLNTGFGVDHREQCVPLLQCQPAHLLQHYRDCTVGRINIS